MIYKLDFLKIDKDALEKESKIFKYAPINYDKLLKLKMNKCDSSNKMTNFLDENDFDWWVNQDTWKASNNADKDMQLNIPETSRILSMFKNILDTDNISANFFTQQKNTEVKTHIDVGTSCAINFIIHGNSTPICFENVGTYFYKNALLDVSKRHSVPLQIKSDRLVFKLRIIDLSFEESYRKIIHFFKKSG